MGVEPTQDDAGRPATVLKTARATGPPPLPQDSEYRTSRGARSETLMQECTAEVMLGANGSGGTVAVATGYLAGRFGAHIARHERPGTSVSIHSLT